MSSVRIFRVNEAILAGALFCSLVSFCPFARADQAEDALNAAESVESVEAVEPVEPVEPVEAVEANESTESAADDAAAAGEEDEYLPLDSSEATAYPRGPTYLLQPALFWGSKTIAGRDLVSGVDSEFSSNFSPGFSLGYVRKLKRKLFFSAAYRVQIVTITQALNRSFEGNSQWMSDIEAYPSYVLFRGGLYGIVARYSQILYHESQNGGTQINFAKSFGFDLGLKGKQSVYGRGKFRLLAEAELGMRLPETISSVRTDLGNFWRLGTEGGFYIESSKYLALQLSYLQRTTNISDLSLHESELRFGASFTWAL